MTADTIEVAFRTALGAFALDAAFTVPATGVTALFGPSGSGKTTLLRCIAGLERAAGRCIVRGDTWQDDSTFLPPHRRPLGYVFQEASLFPHLSVRDNLRFGAPRGRRLAPDDPVVALLGLRPLLDRAPQRLSGGERQRVAIGRALLSEPRLLLMDEPLAALDQAARDEILPFLERLPAALALPILYVSHDREEVERLATHLVVLERDPPDRHQAGRESRNQTTTSRVVATGPLAEVQSDLDLPFTATRNAAVSLDGRVCGYDPVYGLLAVAVSGAVFHVPAPPSADGETRRLRIAATDVSLALDPAPSTIVNVLPARLLRSVQVSATDHVALVALGHDGQGARLLARITRQSWDRLALAPGMRLHAQIKAVALR